MSAMKMRDAPLEKSSFASKNRVVFFPNLTQKPTLWRLLRLLLCIVRTMASVWLLPLELLVLLFVFTSLFHAVWFKFGLRQSWLRSKPVSFP